MPSRRKLFVANVTRLSRKTGFSWVFDTIKHPLLPHLQQRLFTNTKAREDLAQQIIRAKFSGDATQCVLRQAQLFCQQV